MDEVWRGGSGGGPTHAISRVKAYVSRVNGLIRAACKRVGVDRVSLVCGNSCRQGGKEGQSGGEEGGREHGDWLLELLMLVSERILS